MFILIRRFRRYFFFVLGRGPDGPLRGERYGIGIELDGDMRQFPPGMPEDQSLFIVEGHLALNLWWRQYGVYFRYIYDHQKGVGDGSDGLGQNSIQLGFLNWRWNRQRSVFAA